MDGYFIEIKRPNDICEKLEVPDKYGALWNVDYGNLFPEECEVYVEEITQMVWDKYGSNWVGWYAITD